METCNRCSDHSGQDVRILALEKEITLRFNDLERRLLGLNDLRSEVTRDRERFLLKETYEGKTEFYDRWITSVERRLTVIETRSITWTAAIAVFFLIAQVALNWIRS